MIVVFIWKSDGDGGAKFFPEGKTQLAEMLEYIIPCVKAGFNMHVYKISATDEQPKLVLKDDIDDILLKIDNKDEVPF